MRFQKLWLLPLAAVFFAAALSGAAPAGPTLDKVKQNGQISCGVQTGQAGFAAPDSQGRYAGFNVDICKALSAAIFGVAERVPRYSFKAFSSRDVSRVLAADL